MPERKALPSSRLWVLVGLFAGLMACSESDEAGDGVVEGAVEGVSSEEMVGQASPMSLEEAESLGIVDTTVSVGPPVGPDSQLQVMPPAAP